ncbi:MAG: hypothetical protein ACE5F6_18105 [Anaerolineae bacterium]
MKSQDYRAFQSESQRVPYTFLYPADWQVRETVEKERVKVFIAGPRDQGDTVSVGFTVRIWPAAAQTPETVMNDLLSRFSQMPGFQEIGRGSGLVAGKPAVEVEFVYHMLLPLNSRAPHEKTIRQRCVFVRADHALIELIYAAPDEMYDTWLSDFHTLIQTFAFPEKREDRSFHPLVSATDTAPAASLREDTAGYEVKGQEDDQ